MRANQTSISFKTEFAVDMHCQSCSNEVKKSLRDVPGLEIVEIDVKEKRVVVTGTTPPSIVCKALKDTGRQVIVRGSGMASGSHEGAAVAILETPLPDLEPMQSNQETQQVHGIARMTNSSATSSGLGSGSTPSYDVYISKTGDMQSPPHSTGGIHIPLTTITPDPETGYADAFCELEVPIWEVIGRGMVIESSEDVQRRIKEEKIKKVIGGKGRLGVLAGVIARSAGAWGNEKTVCACSGKTMFEESRLMASKMQV